jgi:hypothetical protein
MSIIRSGKMQMQWPSDARTGIVEVSSGIKRFSETYYLLFRSVLN